MADIFTSLGNEKVLSGYRRAKKIAKIESAKRERISMERELEKPAIPKESRVETRKATIAKERTVAEKAWKKTPEGILATYKEKLIEGKAKKQIKSDFDRPERFKKRVEKFLKRKVISRRIFKANRPTLQIRSIEPEPYRSIYFKSAWEQEKRNLFFK